MTVDDLLGPDLLISKRIDVFQAIGVKLTYLRVWHVGELSDPLIDLSIPV